MGVLKRAALIFLVYMVSLAANAGSVYVAIVPNADTLNTARVDIFCQWAPHRTGERIGNTTSRNTPEQQSKKKLNGIQVFKEARVDGWK